MSTAPLDCVMTADDRNAGMCAEHIETAIICNCVPM